jgi:hypothetical protein
VQEQVGALPCIAATPWQYYNEVWMSFTSTATANKREREDACPFWHHASSLISDLANPGLESHPPLSYCHTMSNGYYGTRFQLRAAVLARQSTVTIEVELAPPQVSLLSSILAIISWWGCFCNTLSSLLLATSTVSNLLDSRSSRNTVLMYLELLLFPDTVRVFRSFNDVWPGHKMADSDLETSRRVDISWPARI